MGKAGQPIDEDGYCQRFSDRSGIVAAVVKKAADEHATLSSLKSTNRPVGETEAFSLEPEGEALWQEEPVPKRIGRHEIREVLGQGAFGRVYLAYDPQLERPVAIKVPSQKLMARGLDVKFFVQEARNVANLKHAGLVVVHDVQVEDGRPYIVQECSGRQSCVRPPGTVC